MKTAVSIPDPVFAAADRLARSLGISRSELYARALQRFLSGEDDETTARLDAVYAQEPSGVDDEIARAQRRAVRTPW